MMKGTSKHRTGTSALSVVVALALVAGLTLPGAFAFANGEDGDEKSGLLVQDTGTEIAQNEVNAQSEDDQGEETHGGAEDANATVNTTAPDEVEDEASETAAAAETQSAATDGDYNFDSDFWFQTGVSDFVIDLRNGGNDTQEIDPVKRLVEAGQADNYTISYEFLTEGVVEPTADNTAIKAIATGYTYFRLSAVSNADPSASRSLGCSVWVLGDSTPALSSFDATVEGSKDLTIDVFDAIAGVDFAVNDGAAYKVTATSSNPDVATGNTGNYEYNFGEIAAVGPGTATITFTATDLLDSSNVKSSSIEVTVTNNVLPNYPDPFDEEGNLLPYTVNNGVMTFPGNDKLGEWYRLDLDIDDSVECHGLIHGGGPWTMTIPSYLLDPSDPDYRPYDENQAPGPMYVRGNNGGGETSLTITAKDPEAMVSVKLVPANAGTVRMVGDGSWAIQLNQPATLKATTGDSTNITIGSDSGALISINVDNPDEAYQWSNGLEFFADEFVGEIPAGAFEAMEERYGKALNTATFDLRLIERATGNLFEIPEGQSVTVSLPIPDDWEIGDVKLFHVADDGTITDMNATVDVESRMLTFTTTHFSIFMMANYPKALTTGEAAGQTVGGLADTGDSTAPVAGVAAAAVIAAAAAGFAARRSQR